MKNFNKLNLFLSVIFSSLLMTNFSFAGEDLNKALSPETEAVNSSINIEQQEENTAKEREKEQNLEEKELTFADYNEYVRNVFRAEGTQYSIDNLNKCFEDLCKKINQDLIETAKEKHSIIIEVINNYFNENKLNTNRINGALYELSYILTQNKKMPIITTSVDPSLYKVSLAGYTLSAKYKNKGEHIPNISNVEFLSRGRDWRAPDVDYLGQNSGLNINRDGFIYRIEIRVPNAKTKQFNEYVNSQIAKYKDKKIYTVSKFNSWFGKTKTTYCKGFCYVNDKKEYNNFYIEIDDLKENVGENLWPVYDEKNSLRIAMFTESHDDGVIAYYDSNGNEIIDSLDNYYAEIKFVDHWEADENINKDKKAMIEFLNKYKIGKKLDTSSDEVEYSHETTINNTKMYIFKCRQVYHNGYYNVCIYVDKVTKIIKALEFPSEESRKAYDFAVADVYGIKNYYCEDRVGQKITQKNNITTKITRIKNCNIFYNGVTQGYIDIITSLPKLEL
ncbi:MAG: hypothetical protein IKO48_01310 [Elusimicrobia bacterium]|nr:hypothetical protein [Elusimicrobiota bacterium]